MAHPTGQRKSAVRVPARKVTDMSKPGASISRQNRISDQADADVFARRWRRAVRVAAQGGSANVDGSALLRTSQLHGAEVRLDRVEAGPAACPAADDSASAGGLSIAAQSPSTTTQRRGRHRHRG